MCSFRQLRPHGKIGSARRAFPDRYSRIIVPFSITSIGITPFAINSTPSAWTTPTFPSLRHQVYFQTRILRTEYLLKLPPLTRNGVASAFFSGARWVFSPSLRILSPARTLLPLEDWSLHTHGIVAPPLDFRHQPFPTPFRQTTSAPCPTGICRSTIVQTFIFSC